MLAPVLAPVLTVTFTPGVLRTGLVIAVIHICLALIALPPSSAFALTVRLTTEALLRNLRARPKTRPAGCTLPALHGSPRTDHPRHAMRGSRPQDRSKTLTPRPPPLQRSRCLPAL